jgi:hypothetical protein
MREAERLMSALTVEVCTLRRSPLKKLLPLNVLFHSLSDLVLIHALLLSGHFHGSVFVSINARVFLESMYLCYHNLFFLIYIDLGYLADSPYIDDLEDIVRCFDKATKLRFRKAEEPQYIKFGSTRDNDEAYNIRFGQLKLMG